MTDVLTVIYTSLLYFSCLVFITHYILGSMPRTGVLVSSFCLFIPFSLLVLNSTTEFVVPIYIVFEIAQFFLLKLAFPNIKLRQLIFCYIVLYSCNTVIVSLIVALIPQPYKGIDAAINTITFIVCIVICLTKLRYRVQQILEWTPRYISVISCTLLIIATLISALISFHQFYDHPQVWNQWIQVLTSFLLMAICLVVPVIFVISISNTRLKTLTANYEQQIHAQAEHYKNLAEANHEVRRFRHDFKNIRIGIEKLAEQEKYDEVIAYLREYAEAIDHPGGRGSLFDTGNGIADALLTEKQEKALAHNIVITFTGIIPTEALSPTDLCVLLGNSLDNALDACLKLPPEVSKTVSVSCNCSRGFLFFTVTNPIGEKVEIRNNSILSTKENKTLHGFGLYSLHSIVKKYDGELQLSATDDSFTVNIDLCVMQKTAIS